MIFVTVGTQLPFDRLILAVDQWAQRTQGREIFAQIGPTEYQPKSIQWKRDLQPAEFADRIRNADLIVAHAGMGTIIHALRSRTPILVMPRHADKGEHRNDHQIATVRELSERGLIHAAADENELATMLERAGTLEPLPELPEFASDPLICHVRDFIRGT